MLVRAVVFALLGTVLTWVPAYADGEDVTPGHTTFIASGIDHTGSQSETGAASTSGGHVHGSVQQDVVCALGGGETCGEAATCSNGEPLVYTWFQTPDGGKFNVQSSCPSVAVPEREPEVTPGLVLTALRRIGLPESELMVQPPGGRTLVNFETNFYTDGGEFTRTVTLLGRRVDLRIWPARFGWRFGDGDARWTRSPGSAYPDLEITHRYLRQGRVRASVDTTYAARFRVGGGPWRDVNGTVTIPGTPQGLRVVTARPVLVGG